tara:strand:+ start:563 stop:844 length:282 start_codon:yes stop_codon:yes gene_type:complete
MTRYKNVNGKLIAFTAEEETARATEETNFAAQETANKYKITRTDTGTKTYPDLSEQLDQLFRDVAAGKFGSDAQTGEWYTAIKEVKDTNPKPS